MFGLFIGCFYSNSYAFTPPWDPIPWPDSLYCDRFIEPTPAGSFHPAYSMYAATGFSVEDTFLEKFYFCQGDTLRIYSESLFVRFYIFNEESPSIFSESFQPRFRSSGGVWGFILKNAEFIIPRTGNYYVLATSAYDMGLIANYFRINNHVYNNVYVGHNIFARPNITLNDNNGILSFTTNSNFDTTLFLLGGTDMPGKIIAYNDDDDLYTPYDWGTDSRISLPDNDNIIGFIVTQSIKDSIQCNTIDKKTDVYLGTRVSGSTSFPFFYLVQDDAMCSDGNFDDTYNCLSWALGCWNTWIWPFIDDDEDTETNSFILDDLLVSYGYTRYNTTTENSEIDVWMGTDSYDNTNRYLHFSVKALSNSTALGFDWESKLGSCERIFHPRYSLSGDLYGYPTKYYRRMSRQELQQSNPLYAQVCDSPLVFKNICFTEEELCQMSRGVEQVHHSILNVFDAQYKEVEIAFSQSMASDLSVLSNNSSYKKLFALSQEHPLLLYRAFQKLHEGEKVSVKLILDLTAKNNKDLVSQTRKHEKECIIAGQKEGKNLHLSLLANATYYAKAILERIQLGSFILGERDVDASSDSFLRYELSVKGNTITLAATLESESVLSVEVTRVGTLFHLRPVHNLRQGKGIYTTSFSVNDKGHYVVSLILNGKCYSKQIIID